MMGPAGSAVGVASDADNPITTARGRGNRGRRSKQASRRAAIHRQIGRIINEHNQRQELRHRNIGYQGNTNSANNNNSARNNYNNIPSNTNNNNSSTNNNNNNYNNISDNINDNINNRNNVAAVGNRGPRMGVIRGVEDARRWMMSRLGYNMPETSPRYIEEAVHMWDVPEGRLDRQVLQQEEEDLQRTLRRYYVPRYGNMVEDKEDGVFRIMGANLNGMSGREVREIKIKDIVRIAEVWDVSGGCFSEVGINWARRRYGDRLHDWIREKFEDARVITEYNTTENISKSQVGGVAQLTRGTLAQYARTSTGDFRGLGRWASWMYYADPNHVTRVVAAYNLGPHHSKQYGSAYQQYTRYLQNKGIVGTTPRALFRQDFLTVLTSWLERGERLLIFIDMNEHILTSSFAQEIMALGLVEATHNHWPSGVEPRTYIRGRGPIDAVYHTPSLEVSAVMQLSFHEGVGDHRTVIVDMTSRSMIGKDSFKVCRPLARRLTMKNTASVNKYISILEATMEEHGLPLRLKRCEELLSVNALDETAIAQMELLDVEITQYQTHAERKCRKIRRPAVKFSLPVKHWVHKRWGYQGLLRLHDGGCSNPANIKRTARRAGIERGDQLTRQQALDGIRYCNSRLKAMKPHESHLRKTHLSERVLEATEEKNEGWRKGVLRVISSEEQKSIWRTINRATNPFRGGAITRVEKEQGDELVELVTLDEMTAEIQAVTESRFSLAESAPAHQSSLRSSVGFSADTPFAFDLVRGVEDIPDDVDPTTSMLIHEMQRLWTALDSERKKTFTILPSEFQYYWKRACEKTSSSIANIHFGHWKAAGLSPSLSDFFARKLTMIGTYGSPPTRWGSGLQVMLEKVAGVALVNKLRAILLMEGDFNFFNKWTFGHRAIDSLYNLEYIPQDQYSQKGSTAEDGRMDSRLTTDISRQLRHPMAIAAVDADQCYDRINHTIMSLVLLSIVGAAGLVTALLRPIQTMKFFQRTAWGDSRTYMGGRTTARPLHGLCQGNGAAPACWLMLSSLLMHAYKRQGFGASITSPISRMLLAFMGEMFMDDTDLIVMRPDLRTGEEVFDELQSSVWNWGINLNATGGGLKGPKCYWWLLDYECIDGRWKYTAKVEWDLCIPLPDGTSCIVDQKGSDEAMKMLGVWSCPAGLDGKHLEEIVIGKMDTWLARVRNGHLSAKLAWKAYKWKLWPGLRYGLATLGTRLYDLDGVLTKQQYEVLPLLGVNRNIRKHWRTLPRAFGGIGLFHLPVEQTIGWINMFIQHFGLDSVLAGKFQASLEALQLEIGCTGCPLSEDFELLGDLATECWMKSLWERLHHYGIHMEVDWKEMMGPREGDEPLVGLFIAGGYKDERLRQLNRCRLHLEAMFLSDLVSANGRCFLAADLSSYQNFERRESQFIYPRESPTKEDWSTWYHFWNTFTLTGWSLARPLGSWRCPPGKVWRWWWNEELGTLWNRCTNRWIEYSPVETIVRMRSNRIYQRGAAHEHPPAGSFLPSTISSIGEEVVLLHDTGPPLPSSVVPPTDFWSALRVHGGEWMWDHLEGEWRDMGWLRDALTAGSAMFVADGSYNREIDRGVCGTGWVVVCRSSRKMLRGSFFERSHSASAYRGELLGMVAVHALVANAAAVFGLESTHGSVHCDNLGALGKAKSHNRRVRSSLRQADAVRAIRAMKLKLFLALEYKYVQSHQDDKFGWQELPLDQQLNVLCDTLAKQACMRRISFAAVMGARPLRLPFERAAIIVNGVKMTSDVSDPVRFALGKIEAKRFYCWPRNVGDDGVNKGGLGWLASTFDLVDWDGLNEVLGTKPDMFGIWLAKQSIGVCATRRNTARIDGHDDNVCPNCMFELERSDHLNRCTDPGRTALFESSVARLESWLTARGRTDSDMAFWILAILRLRGEVEGIRLEVMPPNVRAVVEDIFAIGWVEFLHGKIPRSLVTLQMNHCDTYPCGRGFSGLEWTKGFITRLLQISHAQWLYRNFTLHHQTRGYLAIWSKVEVLEKIAELAEVEPDEVPAESRFLLEVDFTRLVLDRTERQEYWVAAMLAAVRAGKRQGQARWTRRGRVNEDRVSRAGRGEEVEQIRLRRVRAALFSEPARRHRKMDWEQSSRKRQVLEYGQRMGNGGRLPTSSRFVNNLLLA